MKMFKILYCVSLCFCVLFCRLDNNYLLEMGEKWQWVVEDEEDITMYVIKANALMVYEFEMSFQFFEKF